MDSENEEYIASTQTCYRFKKEDFKETLKIPEDIIVNISIREMGEKYTDISLMYASSPGTSYANLSCEYFSDKPDNYECFRSDSIEKLQFYMKKKNIYLHVDYVGMSPDSEPIVQSIKSIDKTFVKGINTPCYISKEEKLLQSINIKDVSIYDLAYYKDLVVAVGEDMSPRTMELKTKDEHYESVILRSTDGGKIWKRLKKVSDTPNDNVVVFDEKRIVITSSMEGAGGIILTSSDGGESWKETYCGLIESFEYIDKEIIITDIVGTIFRSKDGGINWHETPVKQDNENKENNDVEKTVENSEDSLAILMSPEYKMNYETNTLLVKHDKNSCHCNAFSLPLTYNQSNTRRGILGNHWSLGIENHITIQSKDKLLFFDGYRGTEKLYIRDHINKNIFYYKGREKIAQTKDGYTLTCTTSTQYFNEDGYLIKIASKERSYVIHYKNKQIDKVTELIKGKHYPYISFSYLYEGVVVTFHHTKEEKRIKLLKDNEGFLSSILEGNHHIFHYTYDERDANEKVLSKIEDIQTNKTLLEFNLDDNKATIDDFRQQKNGMIKEKTYLYHTKGKEHTCVVNTLNKEFQNDVLKDVRSDIDMYHFTYSDEKEKRLISTQHDSETYGFDEMDRVDYYSGWDKEISLTYYPFGKMAHSTVKNGDNVSEYTYQYTKDASHNLQKMKTPNGTIELKYNEKDQIKELIIDKYHLYYEYGKSDRPTKITVLGKGEMHITYDENDNIKSTKTILYNKNTTEHIIALDVSQAMALLIKRVAEGSIKNYPKWIW